MIQVSTFQSSTQPMLFISSAPKDSQYIHYSAKNVSLESVLMGINDQRWKKIIDGLQQRKGGYEQNKKALPCFTPSGTFRIRCDWDLLQYSQIVHLDYDKVADPEGLRDKLSKSPYCYCAFLSPSGKGVKVLVKVNSVADQHDTAFIQVRNVFDALAGVKSDSSVRNLSRLCFVSSDKNLRINGKAQVFEVHRLKSTVTIPDPSILAINNNSAFSWLYNLTLKGKYQGDVLGEYTKSKRNNFIYVFCCNCNRYGIDQSIANEYATQIWVQDNNGLSMSELTHTVASAYKHRNEFSSYRLPKIITQ